MRYHFVVFILFSLVSTANRLVYIVCLTYSFGIHNTGILGECSLLYMQSIIFWPWNVRQSASFHCWVSWIYSYTICSCLHNKLYVLMKYYFVLFIHLPKTGKARRSGLTVWSPSFFIFHFKLCLAQLQVSENYSYKSNWRHVFSYFTAVKHFTFYIFLGW